MLPSYTRAFGLFVHSLHLPWRKTQRENLIRLGGAFLTRRSLPVRRLARTLAGPTPAAKHQDKRLRRFLGNDSLALDAALEALLRFLFARLVFSPAFVPVMLDWTYVGPWAILWASLPDKGRSLPFFATVHERSIQRRVYSQTQAEIALLRRLRWCWPPCAPPPLLLADRGFDKSRLLHWLLKDQAPERDPKNPGFPSNPPQWLFLIRSCMESLLLDERGRRLQKRLLIYPGEIRLHKNVTYHQQERFTLHLVSTAVKDEKTKTLSTWHLITNLPEPWLGKAPSLYAKRMEPEETYRDSKRGYINAGFGLQGLKRMRRDRLERYLFMLCLLYVFFMLCLLYVFLVLLAETDQQGREALRRRHFRLSLISFAFDLLLFTPVLAPKQVRHALATVRLQPLWPQSGDS
jgi:hypothetical protein